MTQDRLTVNCITYPLLPFTVRLDTHYTDKIRVTFITRYADRMSVANGAGGFHIWRVAANIVNK